jgi:bacterioferritin (cytochrome b1)
MRVYAVYSEMSNKFKLGQINKQKKENQERHSNHSDQNVKGVLMVQSTSVLHKSIVPKIF